MKGNVEVSRRSLLAGATAASLSAAPQAGGEVNVANVLKINDLDRRIWQEELNPFVPDQVFDLHCHITRLEFNLDPKARATTHPLRAVGSPEVMDACDALLMPNRKMARILMPSAHPKCAFEAQNEFIATHARRRPDNPGLMLVHPRMRAEDVDQKVRQHRFIGFKCYRWYSVTGDVEECGIADFLPDHLVAVANRYGLMIMLHVAKKAAIADPQNLSDLERLTAKFPRVRWVLAHCARSYSDWAMLSAAPRLRKLPNIWVDTSSVCEIDAFMALFSTIDPRRICYGSDDLPVGITRGKYISYGSGHSWAEMNEQNQTLNRSHCDGRMTFVRYEMLRAIRRAAQYTGLGRSAIEDIFHGNAATLIDSIRRDLAKSGAAGA